MERRKFLALAAGSAAATMVAPHLASAQTPSFEAQTVQGTVMATRGNSSGTNLPVNGPATDGIRHKTWRLRSNRDAIRRRLAALANVL